MTEVNYISNRHTCALKHLLWQLLLAAGCLTGSYANVENWTYDRSIVGDISGVGDQEAMAEYVEGFLRYPEEAQEALNRACLYFPTIEKALLRRGMPSSLKFLPMIESSYRTRVSSRAGAKGLWQLMPGTAREMGLKIDRYVDERSDPAKATEVGLDYLQFLYDRYSDWSLALAAYNCGYGRVDRAIKQAGGSLNYQDVRQFLPQETKKYLPRFAGAQHLIENYDKWGLVRDPFDRDMQLTALVKVYQKISLEDLAKATRLPLEMIEVLNPAIRKDYVPATQSGIEIRVPNRVLRSLTHFLATGEQITNPLRVQILEHQVEEESNYFDVAKDLKVSAFDLMIWNNASSSGDRISSARSIRYYQMYDPNKVVVEAPPAPRLVFQPLDVLPERLDYRSVLKTEFIKQEQIKAEMLSFALHSAGL